jgi:hypothetical protein
MFRNHSVVVINQLKHRWYIFVATGIPQDRQGVTPPTKQTQTLDWRSAKMLNELFLGPRQRLT